MGLWYMWSPATKCFQTSPHKIAGARIEPIFGFHCLVCTLGGWINVVWFLVSFSQGFKYVCITLDIFRPRLTILGQPDQPIFGSPHLCWFRQLEDHSSVFMVTILPHLSDFSRRSFAAFVKIKLQEARASDIFYCIIDLSENFIWGGQNIWPCLNFYKLWAIKTIDFN